MISDNHHHDIQMQIIQTDVAGKVRNIPHYKNEALLPVFEAVVNAIQAIHARGGNNGEIRIHIIREELPLGGGLSIGRSSEDPITGFIITDNGVGFTDDNANSFQTSDSTHKVDIGGKGIGRFIWLKAFKSVNINSIYQEGGQTRARTIEFNLENGIDISAPVTATGTSLTTVKLAGFFEEYRKQPSAYKTTSKIAQRIFEHCFSYFVLDQAPRIVVQDNSEEVDLSDLYRDVSSNILQERILIGGIDFTLIHMKLYSSQEKSHSAIWCAHNRDVNRVPLKSVLGSTPLSDGNGDKFTYVVYVMSQYLDETVDMIRLNFHIPDEPDSLFGSISKENIINHIQEHARLFLRDSLEITRNAKIDIVANYVSNKQPALRSVVQYCPGVYDELDTNSTEEKIHEVLYKYKGQAEYEIAKSSESILRTQYRSLEEMRISYDELSSRITSAQKDNLASYVCHRKSILDLFEKKLEYNAQSSNNYYNEDVIHDLIFPRKSTTDDIAYDNQNLWILDETLVFHAFASSEQKLSKIIENGTHERPDVIAFAEVDEDKTARAVSILEFKKPQRQYFDQNPVNQVLNYRRQISDAGTMKLPNGRVINVNDQTRYYCYAICDINAEIRKFVEDQNYSTLKDNLGYYTYNSRIRAHIEIIAYNEIISDAKRRQRAFFDKLGL